MDFNPNPPVSFDKVLCELEGVRSYPSMITPGVTVHNGKLGIGGCEFHVRATETPDGVLEYSIAMPGESGSTFLGIPFLTSTARFTAALDEKGIPWADDGKSDIVLYEHWMAFFDDVGEITHVLWYNRQLMTDVELLDAAFPPKR